MDTLVAVSVAVEVWITVTVGIVALLKLAKIDEGMTVELATSASLDETPVERNPLSMESSL